MTRYSHSKLDTARKCMRQFKYEYIDKIKAEESDTKASDFGSCCHEIAENYKGGGKAELLALYHQLVPSKYTIVDDYKKKIPLALTNIHDFWKNVLSPEDVKEVKHEGEVTVPLNESINLNGKIDVIVEKVDGRFRIVDYKTNKSKQYANHTNQLAMYMLLLHNKYKIPYDKMDCEVIYLALDPITKRGDEVPNKGYENISKIYKLEETDVACLISEIESLDRAIAKSIEKGSWSASPTKFNCTYCKFNKICDATWVSEDH